MVTPGTRIAAGQLAVGIPARVVRPLRPDESRAIEEIRDRYISLKNDYASVLRSDDPPVT